LVCGMSCSYPVMIKAAKSKNPCGRKQPIDFHGAVTLCGRCVAAFLVFRGGVAYADAEAQAYV
jgi:hypothetical protein